MEDAFAGCCLQSLFEPKTDLSLCINKSIKLFVKDIPTSASVTSGENQCKPNEYQNSGKSTANSSGNSSSARKRGCEDDGEKVEDEKNSSPTESTCTAEEIKKNLLSENLSLLNGYTYFNRIGSNINLLHTELHGLRRDFLFLSKKTKKNIKGLKIIKKKNKIYHGLLDEIKKDRKRKEIYEILCSEIQKLEDVNKLEKKQNKEKSDIENLEKKIQNIENTIKMNDQNIQRAIQQINDIVSTNLCP
ncbi:hypothetical protein, conserved [Plasmodium gonderi]|uniref:Uncharacterized protein n=1 Tax=Plasmodium gonderi TaxID=77519 RepID=A0A1Y1JHZ7_PLAGO|nr:hypothetical protein, conserved [Plasmodium gonderi]GAW81860.1 hypothetical protein, conserved [Plasmodium gonderi]